MRAMMRLAAATLLVLLVGAGGAAGQGSSSNPAGAHVYTGRQTFRAIEETASAAAIAGGALVIDLSRGTAFDVTVDANITSFSVTNAPAGAAYFTIYLTGNGTAYTQSWGSAKFASGVTPTLTATEGKVDILGCVARASGTSIYCFAPSQNF